MTWLAAIEVEIQSDAGKSIPTPSWHVKSSTAGKKTTVAGALTANMLAQAVCVSASHKLS